MLHSDGNVSEQKSHDQILLGIFVEFQHCDIGVMVNTEYYSYIRGDGHGILTKSVVKNLPENFLLKSTSEHPIRGILFGASLHNVIYITIIVIGIRFII